MSAFRQQIIRLATERPDLRKYLVPLLREASEDAETGVVAGRTWNRGQVYGPPYSTTAYKLTPPTNRGPGKCFTDTGNEADRCYVKRELGGTNLSKSDYNRRYRERVLK
jgi:hypothetical protein